jgi:hypothetical protein
LQRGQFTVRTLYIHDLVIFCTYTRKKHETRDGRVRAWKRTTTFTLPWTCLIICFDLWYTVQVITNFCIITAKYASPVLSCLCQCPCQCKCPCHCFMSMSVLHVMLHIHVQHVHSVCPCRCFLSMVYVHNYAECWCRCSMSILHVKLSMSVMNVHVHAASPWQCCMSMSLLRVHVHAACPCPFATCP